MAVDMGIGTGATSMAGMNRTIMVLRCRTKKRPNGYPTHTPLGPLMRRHKPHEIDAD